MIIIEQSPTKETTIASLIKKSCSSVTFTGHVNKAPGIAMYLLNMVETGMLPFELSCLFFSISFNLHFAANILYHISRLLILIHRTDNNLSTITCPTVLVKRGGALYEGGCCSPLYCPICIDEAICIVLLSHDHNMFSSPFPMYRYPLCSPSNPWWYPDPRVWTVCSHHKERG